PDRQCPLVFARRRHGARHLPAIEERDRDHRRRRRARRARRSDREDFRALLHPPAAPGLRAEFGPRSLHFQAYHRGAWRPHPGGEPPARSGGRGREAPGARGALHRTAAGDVMVDQSPTVHASAVLAGARAVLIRGAAGAREWPAVRRALLGAGTRGRRVGGPARRRPRSPRQRPAPALAGLIEVRGLGIRRLDHEPMAVVGLVVDLAAEDAERLPAAGETALLGVPLRRLAVAPGADALALVLALLRSPEGDIKPRS